MSCFKKIGGPSSDQCISGTQLKNGVPCVSTGIPSLDHVIGGSIPIGTLFILEEDVLRNYSRVITKYFLAEGVICKQALLLASVDEDPKEVIKELPSPTESLDESSGIAGDKMKIAWRYEGQNAVDSSFGKHLMFGHNFDLSKHIDAEFISKCDITCWSRSTTDVESPEFNNPLYYDLLKTINNELEKDRHKLSSECKNKDVLRICISSMGSPLWMAQEYEEGYNPCDAGKDITKFVYLLRILLRGTTAVAFITVPTHLFEHNNIVSRLRNSSDTSVRLESFAGSHKETNPVFKDYHGLLHITKLSAINTLAPYVPSSIDLAFKLRRRKFVIEKLHLPPELQESSEREQDDVISAVPACGGFAKKQIDF